jgi:polyhydroxyalkanoate synthase
VEGETGRREVLLAGHSLGGTLGAIFASLWPERVRGLVLVDAPVKFGVAGAALDRMVALSPRAEWVTGGVGNVAGCVLDVGAYVASRGSFEWEREADWVRSSWDAEAMRVHMAVERWTLDESAMARRLFEQVVEELYREDRFMRGVLEVGGRAARPERVRAALLSVAERESDVVPGESVVAFGRVVGCEDRRVLWYEREVGVALQHVGALVGRRAHRELWPQIVGWMVERWAG